MASALEAKGYKVICNKLGANMLSGIATTVLQEMSIFGKLKADYACLEIDEAYTPIVFDYVKPDVMVITNYSVTSLTDTAKLTLLRILSSVQ